MNHMLYIKGMLTAPSKCMLSGKRRVSYSQASQTGGVGSQCNTEVLHSLEGESLSVLY
jgi:hypothetical protein